MTGQQLMYIQKHNKLHANNVYVHDNPVVRKCMPMWLQRREPKLVKLIRRTQVVEPLD